MIVLGVDTETVTCGKAGLVGEWGSFISGPTSAYTEKGGIEIEILSKVWCEALQRFLKTQLVV